MSGRDRDVSLIVISGVISAVVAMLVSIVAGMLSESPRIQLWLLVACAVFILILAALWLNKNIENKSVVCFVWAILAVAAPLIIVAGWWVDEARKPKTFVVGTVKLILHLGSVTMVQEVPTDAAPSVPVPVEGMPVRIHFKVGKLSISATAVSDNDNESAVIEMNKLVSKPWGWEAAADDTRLELVDLQNRPVLQLEKIADTEYSLRGFFKARNHLTFVVTDGILAVPRLAANDMTLTRFFTYPPPRVDTPPSTRSSEGR